MLAVGDLDDERDADEQLLARWHGGHDTGGTAGPYLDYAPAAGRVVLFRSSLMHEVLPNLHATRKRCAITMWACNLV